MSGDWALEWQGGSLYVLANRTGEDAFAVRFSAHGPMVSGQFGERDWVQELEFVAAGDGVRKVFKAAFGARANPPYVLVEWTDDIGESWTQQLEIPR